MENYSPQSNDMMYNIQVEGSNDEEEQFVSPEELQNLVQSVRYGRSQ